MRQSRSWVPAGGGARLLERSVQLSALGEALTAVVSSGQGRIVLIPGEAGIGKTSLLRRFRAGLGGLARVLWAGCDPLFTPRPLGPVLDLAPALGGELAARAAGGARPWEVAAALMGELAAGPSVLVLEDVHWADEATLDVVRLAGRRIEDVPVLLVLSWRDDELDRSHPLRIVLGDLPGSDRVTQLTLAGLSAAAVAELAGPAGVDPGELHRWTDGNPFFVTEALAAGTGPVPRSVRDAVLGRAARLGPAAREVLDAAAVVPGPVELWLLDALAAAVGINDDDDAALRWGRRAIELAERIGCLDAIGETLNIVGTVELRRGDLDGLTKLDRSRELAEQAGDALGVARAYMHRS